MKIAGFNGKFHEPGTVPGTSATALPSSPAKRTVGFSRPRPDASFKIKDSLRQAVLSQPAAKVEAVNPLQENGKEREPFDEAMVVAALEKYIADHKPEPTVSVALKTHRPFIEGEKIVLLADNQIQLEKLEAMKMHLCHILAKYLRNCKISLEFRLFDSQSAREEKKLFTASEKFEHFVRLNPVVADLKNIFGLELE